ncbi:MAG: crotonase [Conexibacter sp.]|nr:crotonase [Conexibacter sp.]
MSIGVDLDAGGRVAVVTIARPEVLNALDAEHALRLQHVWDDLEQVDGLRVAILTGAGDRAFCAGADMKAGDDAEGLDYLAARRADGFGAISLRRTLPVPVIARVNGVALGGGFEMVLGCDLAVATEDATFGLPEALVGRVPLDGGVPLVARALPPKVAAEVLLAGRRLTAREALHWGLVNRVVAAGELDAAVDELTTAVLAAAPLSQRAIKDMLSAGDGHGTHASHALTPPSLLRALTSDDGREGVVAFRERRAPSWQGR